MVVLIATMTKRPPWCDRRRHPSPAVGSRRRHRRATRLLALRRLAIPPAAGDTARPPEARGTSSRPEVQVMARPLAARVTARLPEARGTVRPPEARVTSSQPGLRAMVRPLAAVEDT